MMSIGGEMTGWVLHCRTPQGMRAIEVDILGLHGESVQGSVRLTGNVIRREYNDRGSVLLLRATKMEKVNELPSAPPASLQPPPVPLLPNL
jgi:hypothetical protein